MGKCRGSKVSARADDDAEQTVHSKFCCNQGLRPPPPPIYRSVTPSKLRVDEAVDSSRKEKHHHSPFPSWLREYPPACAETGRILIRDICTATAPFRTSRRMRSSPTGTRSSTSESQKSSHTLGGPNLCPLRSFDNMDLKPELLRGIYAYG